MKILHITYEYPNPWVGWAPAIYELIKHQSFNKDDTIYVAKAGLKTPVRCGKNIEFYGMPSKLFGLILSTSLYSLLVYFYLKRFKGVDIVVAHNNVSLVFSIYKMLFGRWDKTPYVCYFHISTFQYEQAWKKSGEYDKEIHSITHLLSRLSEKLALKYADFIYGGSWEVLYGLSKISGVPYEKGDQKRTVRVLHPGLDVRHYSTNLKGLRSSFYLDNKKVLLFLGYIANYSRAHLLLEVLEKLGEDFVLFIVGDADPVYLKHLEKEISSHNLNHRVVLKPDVFYKEYVEYYQTADLVIIPSIKQMDCSVVIESLASGKAVLWQGNTYGAEVEDTIAKYAVVLEDDTVDGIAASVRRILKDPASINVKEILDKYSWESRVEKLNNTLSGLVRKANKL